MQNQAINDYIKQSRAAGFSDGVIRQNLISSGWAAADIDNALTSNPAGFNSASTIPVAVQKKSVVGRIIGISLVVVIIIGVAGGLLFHALTKAVKNTVAQNKDLATKISQSLDKRDFANAITLTDQLLKDTKPSEDNLIFFAVRGQAKQELGKIDDAQADYQLVLPLVDKLSNTDQRKYDFVYFGLAKIYFQKNNLASAQEFYQKGLILTPADTASSLELGQVYENSGQKDKAIAHYQQLQKSFTNSEVQFIAAYKLDKLLSTPHTTNYSQNEIYEILPIRLYPADDIPNLNLQDTCVVLKIRFSQNCEVMPKLAVDYSKIQTLETDNLDASQFVAEVLRLVPAQDIQAYTTIVITNKFIGQKDVHYLFSHQDFDRHVALISTDTIARFMPQMAEKDLIFNRRVALQSISTVGQMLNYARETYPACPLAYINNYDEFTNRKTILCQPTQGQLESWLQKNQNFKRPITPQESAEISNVYQKYYMDQF